MALTRAPPGRSCWVRRRPRRADHRPAAGHRDAIFAGLRAHELEALQWRHVNLAAGRITVGESKTAADAYREIDLLPILRDELAAHKAASARARPDDLVFTTRTGAPRDRYNLRQRVVLPVARKAAELLDARDAQPLPVGVSPHKLRHTVASILVPLGSDPASVMAQIGHTDPRSRCASTRTRCAATKANATGCAPWSRAANGQQWALAPPWTRLRTLAPRSPRTTKAQQPWGFLAF